MSDERKPMSVREAFDPSAPLPPAALSALDYMNRKDAALEAAEARVEEAEAELHEAERRVKHLEALLRGVRDGLADLPYAAAQRVARWIHGELSGDRAPDFETALASMAERKANEK